MKWGSLRVQLTVWYASLVAGALLLLALYLLLEFNRYSRGTLEQAQVRRARQVAEAFLSQVNQTGEAYVSREIRAVYSPEANDRFFRITRQDGSILFLSGTPADRSFDPQTVPALSPFAAESYSHELTAGKDNSLIIGAVHYRAPDGNRFLVEVGAPTAPIRSLLDRLGTQLLIGLPVVLLLVVGGGYYLVQRALAVMDHIGAKAENITQHNLSERLPVPHTADEVERLSISLNHMIARLEDAVLNAKRFGADASHELRTPLTILRGELESMVQDPQLDLDLRTSLCSMLEEVEHLAHTVEGLLAISRLDSGEAQTEWVDLDLADLVSNTADQMSLLAEDKNISIACEASGPVHVAGDRARLKQMLVNLLDNAVKYTPEKGSIRLRVQAVNGHALLEVEDTGIGIPPEALPHIFERFFRVDKARSRDAGGSGLGLSIVKSICTAHNAVIDVESTTGKGTCFRIKIPMAQAHSRKNHNNAN